MRARAEQLPVHFTVGGVQPAGELLLAAEIERLGLGEMVEWVGSTEAPADFLRQADAFLLLSRYEGMPNALLEAMALGLPCVATAVGDLEHIAAESGGLKVVPVADVRAAFEALRDLIQQPEVAAKMGAMARSFSQEKFCERNVIEIAERAFATLGASEGGNNPR